MRGKNQELLLGRRREWNTPQERPADKALMRKVLSEAGLTHEEFSKAVLKLPPPERERVSVAWAKRYIATQQHNLPPASDEANEREREFLAQRLWKKWMHQMEEIDGELIQEVVDHGVAGDLTWSFILTALSLEDDQEARLESIQHIGEDPGSNREESFAKAHRLLLSPGWDEGDPIQKEALRFGTIELANYRIFPHGERPWENPNIHSVSPFRTWLAQVINDVAQWSSEIPSLTIEEALEETVSHATQEVMRTRSSIDDLAWRAREQMIQGVAETLMHTAEIESLSEKHGGFTSSQLHGALQEHLHAWRKPSRALSKQEFLNALY